MTAATHTPTPWRELHTRIDDSRGYQIAHLDLHGKSEAERDANRHLIAAAPDLLAALEAALAVIADYLEYEHNGDPWTEDARSMGEMDIDDYQRDGRLESARAVVAKATGAKP
jgi:hypothetical protein